MTLATEVEAADDRAVVVKRASGTHTEPLRREGERLLRASHPGVVEVLRSAPAGEGWELRTAHAGRPLSTLDRPTVPQVAAIVAAVASTVADLHHLGIVHGRLEASRVLLGDHGRPVLCGFGSGIEAARPEDDVAALGELLGELLGQDDDGEPIPERRWRRGRSWSGWDRRALLLLADQACAEPPTRRPTARRLAAAITEAVPERARLDRPAAPPDVDVVIGEIDPIESLRASALVDDDKTRASRPPAIVLVGLGAAMLVAGAWRLSGGEGSAPPVAIDTVPASPPTSAASELHTATPVAGSLLTVEGRRYRVGQDGDQLLVEDWDCDGVPTPALLRPATGEVYVFPRWADRDELAVEPVLQVAGAEALVSEVSAQGCPTLAVRTPSGELVPVIEAVG